MTQESLIQLASEAKRFEKITRHLKVHKGTDLIPIHSLALELANERHHDPLRQLKDNKAHDR